MRYLNTYITHFGKATIMSIIHEIAIQRNNIL